MIKRFYGNPDSLVYLSSLYLNGSFYEKFCKFNFKGFYLRISPKKEAYKVTSEKMDYDYITILFEDYMYKPNRPFHITLCMSENKFKKIESYYFEFRRKKEKESGIITDYPNRLNVIIQNTDIEIIDGNWQHRFLQHKGEMV